MNGFNQVAMLYLLSIFIGTALVSLSPFLRKLWGEEIEEWDHRYTILAILSYIIAVIVSFVLYSLNPISTQDPAYIMAQGFMLGLGSKPLLEEVWKHLLPDWWE